MPAALKALAIAVWAAVLLAMASWSDFTLALTGAALATFALGALIGRWWGVLVVLVPGLLLVLLSISAGTDDRGEGSGVEWAAWFFAPATLLAAAVLALGVLCRRLAQRARRLERVKRGAAV
jgi:hypothetical protein